MSRVEITQEHINISERVARAMARTPFGNLAGADELVSESLVLLVEIADEYDPNRAGSFERFMVSRLKQRLIDYLRHTYGRARKVNRDGTYEDVQSRLNINFGMLSLDEERTPGEIESSTAHSLVDAAPSVEDQVIQREEWRQFLGVASTLTQAEKDALMWPAWADNAVGYQRTYGIDKFTASYNRSQAKDKVCALLGRERYIRPKAKNGTGERRRVDVVQTEETHVRTDTHGTCDEVQVEWAASLDRGSVLAVNGVLALDRLSGQGRLRAARQGASRTPSRLGVVRWADPRGSRTGSPLRGPVLCSTGALRASDPSREQPPRMAATPSTGVLQEQPRPVDPPPHADLGPDLLPGVQPRGSAAAPGKKGRSVIRKFTLSDEELLAEIAKGRTQTDIAKDFDVQPATVHSRLRRLGKTRQRKTTIRAGFIPWVIPTQHTNEYEIRMLRNLVRLAEGRDLKQDRQNATRRFLKYCLDHNVKVAFSVEKGFSYVQHRGLTDTHPYRFEGYEDFLSSGSSQAAPIAVPGLVCPACRRSVA